ncbi:hypothetical protein [Guptibacillus hwajinpoensis]
MDKLLFILAYAVDSRFLAQAIGHQFWRYDLYNNEESSENV